MAILRSCSTSALRQMMVCSSSEISMMRGSAIGPLHYEGSGAKINGKRRSTTYARFIHRLVDSRSDEHTSELQSLLRIAYAVFCSTTTTIILHTQLIRNK